MEKRNLIENVMISELLNSILKGYTAEWPALASPVSRPKIVFEY